MLNWWLAEEERVLKLQSKVRLNPAPKACTATVTEPEPTTPPDEKTRKAEPLLAETMPLPNPNATFEALTVTRVWLAALVRCSKEKFPDRLMPRNERVADEASTRT